MIIIKIPPLAKWWNIYDDVTKLRKRIMKEYGLTKVKTADIIYFDLGREYLLIKTKFSKEESIKLIKNNKK